MRRLRITHDLAPAELRTALAGLVLSEGWEMDDLAPLLKAAQGEEPGPEPIPALNDARITLRADLERAAAWLADVGAAKADQQYQSGALTSTFSGRGLALVDLVAFLRRLVARWVFGRRTPRELRAALDDLAPLVRSDPPEELWRPLQAALHTGYDGQSLARRPSVRSAGQAHGEGVVHDLLERRITALTQKLGRDEASPYLYSAFGGGVPDWRQLAALFRESLGADTWEFDRIAATEVRYAYSLGFLASTDARFLRVVLAPDACADCRRLFPAGSVFPLEQVLKLYERTGGFQPQGRMNWLPILPLHPSCRCTWIASPPP
jgi:hypothetical protein